MRRYYLYQTDCLSWLRKRKANSIQAVVTDPPYGLVEFSEAQTKNSRKGDGVWRLPNRRDGNDRNPTPRFTVMTHWDRIRLRAFVLNVGVELYRVLVPGAHVFWASHPLLSYVVSGAFVEIGFEKRGEIIRTISTLRGGDRPKGAESEFSGVCVLPKGCWEPWALFRKPFDGRISDNLRRRSVGALRRSSAQEPFRDLIQSGPAPKSERRIAPHPALKPQAFLRQIVRASLPLGRGTVLDPFMGAGSTIGAAVALGLKSIGIEKDPVFYRMALRAVPRLAKLHYDT